MIRNGGGLIDVTLCDGFLYCASVFSKSIANTPKLFKHHGVSEYFSTNAILALCAGFLKKDAIELESHKKI